MGKIHPDLIGALTGNVGKVSYYVKGEENLNRRHAIKVKPTTEVSVLEQRLKFGKLASLAKSLNKAITLGFPDRPDKWLATNMFTHRNMGAVTVTDLENEETTVDYTSLRISEGGVRGPKVTASYTTGTHALAFEVVPNATEYWGEADDEVYVTVLDEESNVSLTAMVGMRGEGGSMSIELPEEWSLEHLHVYAFATTAKHREASMTKYIVPTTGS